MINGSSFDMKKTNQQKKTARKKKLVRLINSVFSEKKCAAVIVAAGGSTRMGEGVDKQYIEVSGVPVLARSIAAFENTEDIEYIIVVVRKGGTASCRKLISDFGFKKVKRVVEGGESRQDSVLRGVDALDENTEFVAIHDGARCLVTPEMIKNVLDTAKRTGAASAGAPVKDTIKQVSLFKVVESTPDRGKLWMAQTPQIFKSGLYRAAAYYAVKKGVEATDDNSLIERLNGKVNMVDCGYSNIKITTPEDVAVAEALLKIRKDADK